MARLTGGAIAGIDMDSVEIGNIPTGTVTSRTSTRIVVAYGDGLTDTFEGEAFQFDASGNLTGGTLTRLLEQQNGTTLFDVTGFSVPATTFVQWIESNDTAAAFNIILGGADTLTGTAFADRLFGFAGSDLISSGAGDDFVDGGFGSDEINGGEGDDYLLGGFGDDLIYAGSGVDTVLGEDGNDVFRLSTVSIGFPDSFYDGGPGIDTFDYSVAASGLLFATTPGIANSFNVMDNRVVNVERIISGSGSDSFSLSNLGSAMTIYAGHGQDYLASSPGTAIEFFGQGGNEIIFMEENDFADGGEGDDEFFISGSFSASLFNSYAYGGSGYDTLKLNIEFFVDLETQFAISGSTRYVVQGFEQVLATAHVPSSPTTVRGSYLPERLAINPLFEGMGAVTFEGRGGDDVLVGSGGDDTLSGDDGHDDLTGKGGADRLDGGEGNDRLSGGAGSDRLNGGGGLDTAIYSGSLRAYAITSGTVAGLVETYIAGGPETGKDTLIGVERALLVDGVLDFRADTPVASIMRLYRATFDRSSDQDGLDYWAGRLAGGESLRNVAAFFAGSPEFQTKFGQLSNTAFVEQLYHFTLGRAGQSQDVQFWVDYMEKSGATRGDVLLGFSESAEHVNRTAVIAAKGFWQTDADAARVSRMYDAALDRLPDLDGLTFWTNSLKAGLTVEQMSASFIGSAEFQNRYGSLSNSDFINQLYQFCLNRPADANDLSYWLSRFDQGVSRAFVLTSLSESAEHVALTKSLWAEGVQISDASRYLPQLQGMTSLGELAA